MICNTNTLIQFAEKVCLAAGLSPREAELFSRSLVYADMRGLHSHGLMRMSTYIKRIQTHLIDVNVEPIITRDASSLLAIDGQNGLGVCVGQRVMELCVERAEKTGVCFGAVRNCNHFGYAEFFTRYASDHHMIGFAVANSPKAVAPFGGARPMFGTNPLSITIPSGGDIPYALDMATSLAAQGKVILARKEGREVPLGWGLDAQGNQTTNPDAILSGGTLLPFGGPKGYGIILAIEIFCACLAGGEKSTTMGSMYGEPRKQGTGFVIGAINVGKLVDADEFELSVEQLLQQIKNSPKSAGTEEIFSPGEIEARKFRQAEQEGIELSDVVLDELAQLGQEFHTAFPYASHA
jgi:Malate/L-lactate dehydrogenases